jgi:hypothetical protein
MDALDELKEVVAERRFVRLIEDDVYSVLPDTSVLHHYDKRAAVYDLVVSTRLLLMATMIPAICNPARPKSCIARETFSLCVTVLTQQHSPIGVGSKQPFISVQSVCSGPS